MIDVTEKAQEKIDNYFKDNPKASVRIQVGEGSCCGQYLGIAIDEAKEGDNKYEANGVTYVIAKDLAAQLGRITIDFAEKDGMSWFQVTPENPLSGSETAETSCCS